MSAPKNEFRLSDDAPSYRRQGFQGMITHLPAPPSVWTGAARQEFSSVVNAFLIGVIAP